ncbi:MAG: hypothetical protein ACRD3Q_09900, partial [Terriglobales bacterium]
RELVERYDADGLLLDFVRYPSLFDPDHDLQDTQMFTDYVGQVRAMLDEVGRKKGKYLPLAVQVLARPNENLHFGEDVGEWMRKNYVQYVLPSQLNNIDLDVPMELWVSLRKNTHSRIYPTLHPYFRFPWTTDNRATRDTMRATAHLYYAEGADGLSTMNMFDPLQDLGLREVSDPEKVACAPYDYRFLPKGTMKQGTDKSMTWETTPIRIPDDPAKLAAGTLWLTVSNLRDQDALELRLNGKSIPKPESAGRAEWVHYASKEENTSRFAFPLSQLPLVKGINQLGILLHSSRAYDDAWVTIKEVDVVVPKLGGCAGESQ